MRPRRMHAGRRSKDFRVVPAKKIDMATRLELLVQEYVWLETRPAVRFQIDGHTSPSSEGRRAHLMEECGVNWFP
jgi:hypothetical protein